jgi:hypothetical protein
MHKKKKQKTAHEKEPRSSEAFWQHVKAVSEVVATWPAWKRSLTIGAPPRR